jgi:uncharacterized protein (UPF0332 family)
MIAEEFLQLANRLSLGQKSGPADFRTAISRAYYAVYHLARKFLNEEMGFHCARRDQEHQWIQRHFLNCSAGSAASEIGRHLQNMHEDRKCADYELNDMDIEAKSAATAALERAREVEALLQACASAANVPTVKAEMLQYRKRANVQ